MKVKYISYLNKQISKNGAKRSKNDGVKRVVY